jgi:hypothetical protein
MADDWMKRYRDEFDRRKEASRREEQVRRKAEEAESRYNNQHRAQIRAKLNEYRNILARRLQDTYAALVLAGYPHTAPLPLRPRRWFSGERDGWQIFCASDPIYLTSDGDFFYRSDHGTAAEQVARQLFPAQTYVEGFRAVSGRDDNNYEATPSYIIDWLNSPEDFFCQRADQILENCSEALAKLLEDTGAL